MNGLQIPFKRKRFSKWIKKEHPNYMVSTRNPLKI